MRTKKPAAVVDSAGFNQRRASLFEAVRELLRGFFRTLKAKEGNFRFVFLTGITRFRQANLFSGFNNPTDLTLESRYGTLLGYTEAELEANFGWYLDEAGAALGMGRAELLTRLREHYDGFTFDQAGKTHVYCPWSILSFFASEDHQFRNHWFASAGEPSVLMNWLVRRRLEAPIGWMETVPMDPQELLSSVSFENMDANLMLQQVGYLTIRSVDPSGMLRIGYPNREVAASMAQLYAKMLTENRFGSVLVLVGHLIEGNVEGVVKFCNDAFNGLDYLRHPVNDENTFRSYLHIFFYVADLQPQTEVHYALGRSDLEVTAGRIRWVFEFKFSEDESAADDRLEEAVRQIRERRYGMTALGEAERRIRVAMVYAGKERRIVRWAVVPED